MEFQPQWPYLATPDAAVTVAPSRARRGRDKWAQLAPYFVACVAVSVAVTVLLLFLIWRTGMQAQVDLLRHQVAATQAPDLRREPCAFVLNAAVRGDLVGDGAGVAGHGGRGGVDFVDEQGQGAG